MRAKLFPRILFVLLFSFLLALGYREQAFVSLVSFQGDIARSLEALERARELNPSNPFPLILEGEKYLHLGLYDYAYKTFSLAIEMGGGVRAIVGLGDVLFAQGRTEEALEQWRKALRLSPRDPTLHRRIGKALLKLGELKEAAYHLERADDPCLLALTIAPFEPLRAISLAQNCPEIRGLSTVLSYPDKFLLLKKLGGFYIAMGEYGAAKVVLEKALELYPETAEVWALLGHALSRLGQDPTQAFAKSLKLDYAFPMGHYLLGLHLLSQGKLEEAKRRLLYALSLEPSNPYFHTALAEIEIRRGNYKEAENRLKRAVELAPEELSFRLSLAELQIATLMRADDEAMENVRKVLEFYPDEPMGWELAGIAYYYAGQIALAESCLKKVLELSPDSLRALYYLGLVYSLKGEKEKARQTFRQIQEIAPSSIWAQRAYWAERR